VSLIFTTTICSIGPSLLDVPSTFLIYIGLSIFFNLNPYFLMNSELITNPVAPLSNNASTITSSCISILSSPIFTITSLSSFSLFGSQQNVLSITLEIIFSFVYCFLYIPVFCPLQFCLLFLYFYNFLLYVQNLHSCSSFYFLNLLL